MRLGRDWEVHYFAHHDEWGVDASYPDNPTDDPRDRYDLFDSDMDESDYRLIAAAPSLLKACESALDELELTNGFSPAISDLKAAIALTVPRGTTEAARP